MTGEPARGLNRLRIDTGVDGHQSTVRLVVDGIDLLDTQQPAVSPSGRPRRGGPMRFLPPDPTVLLPPDSAVLLPTAAGTQALVGVCPCGEAGCSSLVLEVSRDGDTVVWGPDPDPPRYTVDRAWRFDLLGYLHAVDTAAAAALAEEDRARRLARKLRRRRDRYDGWILAGSGSRLLDARAWAGIDEVHLSLATPTGMRWAAVPVIDGEPTDDFCVRVALLDPDHPPELPARPSGPA